MGTGEHLSKRVTERTYSSGLMLNVVEGEFKEYALEADRKWGKVHNLVS